MKSTFLKITLMSFITIGAFSCKNTEKEAETTVEEAAQATEMATEYSVDAAASQINWEGAKPTGKHHGTIDLASGTIHLNEGKVEAGSFTFNMNSINVEDLTGEDKANLEAHLKGTVEGKEGDFFNATEYPTAKFEMTGIENNMVKGNLTIKDKTNPIEFPATVSIEGDKMTLKSETFEIDRTKWDVNYGSKSVFPSLGDKFINDTIKLNVLLVATKA
ncbi:MULTISPECIES: YceI family protein [Aequorivita]|jgi:polyisoprenoid-binding protein YceI|uniref:YceI family protein n=2 Tax=Aequorivita TaxID=153265 RepID=A0AB35YXE8_9FLAO|nr:YceI family protein [Aequorivita sp. Ant34-E75]WGF91217.1 YceI family protein [Aequorivita sp. Ant34-E75]